MVPTEHSTRAIAAALIRHGRDETPTRERVEKVTLEYEQQIAWATALPFPSSLGGAVPRAAAVAALLGGVSPLDVEDCLSTLRERTAPTGRDASSALLLREYAIHRIHSDSLPQRYAFILRRFRDFANGLHRERIRHTNHAPGRRPRCPAQVQMSLALGGGGLPS